VDLLELIDLLEIDTSVRSPATPIKLVTAGRVAGLAAGSRVIDFGCGCGEALALWTRYLRVSGLGIDRDADFCRRANDRLAREGAAERVQVICADAAAYPFAAGSYDVASCIGASMIWGGFRPTIHRMREAIGADGRLIVGEPYYTQPEVPPELIAYDGRYHTEPELFQISREEGFEVGYVARASEEDWDRYIFGGHAEVEGIQSAADPGERRALRDKLHRWQDMYVCYRRAYQRWAIYVLWAIRG
jgi:SAM-dependent methyltransferase